MCTWQFEILLAAFIYFFGAFNQTSTEWRTIYIIPKDSNHSLVSCPVDHCYYLHDVLSNSSYFFHSHTTLELLPGMYNITEKVGQVVLSNVSNFTLKGSSPNATIIACLSGASLGITIVQSQNVEISNIQIRHCFAKLELEESNRQIHQTYDKLLKEISCIKYDSSSKKNIYSNKSYLAFNSFLASFKNEKVTIYNTTILHSKGTGITSFDTRDLDVYKVRLAYNGVNCIIFVLDSTNTVITMTQSQINFGKSMSCSFASGLNLFLFVKEKMHNIYLANFMFTDNRGEHGNFLMVVHTSRSYAVFYPTFYLNISITNISSVQTSTASPGHGMVITYEIYLDLPDDLPNNLPEPLLNNSYVAYLLCNSDTYLLIFDTVHECYTWYQSGLSRRKTSLRNLWSKEVYIVLQNCSFIGSCVTIKDSKSWFNSESYYVLTFVMEKITIRESRCPVAFSVINSDLVNTIYLSDLTIINSLNIILVDIINMSLRKPSLKISGNTSFLANRGSVLIPNDNVEFKHFVLICNNTAYEYESVFQISDSISVSFEGEIRFINNTGRQGGAISAYNSNLYFNGNISFIDNSAGSGGAISLKEDARINLQKDTHIIFLTNAAVMYGGGIFIEDASFWASRHFRCFIQINNRYGYNSYNYSIEFENNTAGIAGAALFGGWIDFCGTENSIKPSNILDFKAENSVASNPTRVCMCTNSTLNKFKTEARMDVFPGQTFEIEVVAVGQRFGMVPASIRAEGIDVLGQFQKVQDTKSWCTKLKFTIQSSNKNETMLLNIDGQIMPKWINRTVPNEFFQFKVFINLKGCPLGFEFDNRQNICSCLPYLGAHGVQCNFTVHKLSRSAQQWIGVLSPAKTVVIHQHCPYDYCKPYALLLNLSAPNDQCSFNRSGILCGACQPGLSQVLGTSNCKRCSNLSLLLIFVFALAGMLLVAGLIKLNITVSMGTINGLIFYANIVRANTATFFPGKMANTFLSWFIAWLNLDVGIETCFYNGLDAYMKTWLQFTFPLYIWLLVTLIVFSSKYSQRATRLFGVNAVHVLATLFLLSYAKLLRVTITVFQPTHLLNSHKIWHYDGNLAYFGKQHIILMIVAFLFFVIFFIPYTIVLLGIQWLQMFSHYKPFCWVNKLKPLFDAYTGPYKDKHRCWTGLLLLVRIGLFIVFSTNTSGDPAINMLAIIVVIIGLFTYLAIFGGVYKLWLLNVLEFSSLINLIILCVTMLYTISADKANHVLSQVSVSITLCTAVLVIAYHGLVVILKVVKIDPKVKVSWRRNKEEPENDNQLMRQCGNAVVNPPVTYSVIELTEPLLEC